MVFISVILLFLFMVAIVAIYSQLNRSKKKNVEADNQLKIVRSQLTSVQKDLSVLTSMYRESEVLANIVRQSPNAIMLMNENGDIQWVNRGFEEMYEYNFLDFTRTLGNNYRQTSFSPDVQSRLNFIAETGQSFRYEALNVTRTGKELWTQTALVPIFDDKGNLSNMVTIDADIHTRVAKSDNLILEMEQLNSQIDHLTMQFKHLEINFLNLFGSINELYELIEQTDQILHFITTISNETRILGFNASIEAGRAGEHGRGFRVITNTIVDISKNTIQSVGEISNIVNSINEKQQVLILQKNDSETQMGDYHKLVSELKKEVAEIKNSIEEFKTLA